MFTLHHLGRIEAARATALGSGADHARLHSSGQAPSPNHIGAGNHTGGPNPSQPTNPAAQAGTAGDAYLAATGRLRGVSPSLSRRRGRLGEARRGGAGLGEVWPGEAGRGAAGRGKGPWFLSRPTGGFSESFGAWSNGSEKPKVWQGGARRGVARLGLARHGKGSRFQFRRVSN